MQQTEQADRGQDASCPMPAGMQAPEARKRAIRESLAKLDAAETSHLHPNAPDDRTMRMRGARLALGVNAQSVVDGDSDLVVAAREALVLGVLMSRRVRGRAGDWKGGALQSPEGDAGHREVSWGGAW